MKLLKNLANYLKQIQRIYRFYDIINNVLIYGTDYTARKVIYKEVGSYEKSV